MRLDSRKGYDGYSVYYGDIHNHCGLSYGLGSADDAFHNARMQLDFVSVTGHSFWPDMPRGERRLDKVVDYHERGFKRFEDSWQDYLRVTEANNDPGRFVTFPSFEWHSMEDGDCVLYYRDAGALDSEGVASRKLITAHRLDELRTKLGQLGCDADSVMIVPHHIGYLTGYRGINWDTFDESLSPFVEIVSMHGFAENDDGASPYLHTMGPRVGRNTMQGGLYRRKRFGVIGSTDHHNAHPGSYGHGRIGVWAESLTRDGLWRAFRDRRVYALTGDNIALSFGINGAPMGSTIKQGTASRDISVRVRGVYALEAVEIIKNGRLLSRSDSRIRSPGDTSTAFSGAPARGVVRVAVGWGETGVRQDWTVGIELMKARIVSVEPHFRGVDLVDPDAKQPDAGAAGSSRRSSSWTIEHDRFLRFTTVTYGNANPSTDSTQAVSIEFEADAHSAIRVTANGVTREFALKALALESQAFYLGGFLSSAVHLHRCVSQREYEADLNFVDTAGPERGTTSDPSRVPFDYYYARVAQQNGQWAWSSPIWVENQP